jgi:thymidylate synthase
MQTRNIVIFSKPYEILSMKYLRPCTINTQNIFFQFYYLTELLVFFLFY